MQTGEALAPAHEVSSYRFMVAAMILGAAGSMIALAAFSAHEYRVGPLIMELQIMPTASGETRFAIQPVTGLRTGFAEAPTHMGFLSLRGTVTGVVGVASLPDAVLATKDAKSLATIIKDEGKDAFRRFGLRVGWLTLAGGGAGGMAIALFGMKARRVFQGALGGVILVGVLGLVAWQTYDIDKFDQVQFKQAGQAAPLQGG
ncbi:MAG TPA: hypothetical protein VJ922_03845 [Actinomycetota bacterium]|nr:hypothetical protein [Actinomycetota bacterium]